MKWCSIMNMWCSDIDEEDMANIGCDGDCRHCEECEEVQLMYNPCFECFNRYGRSYSEECKCQYAKAVNMLNILESYCGIDEIVEILKGDKFPIVFIDKDHIDSTYKIVCAAKDGFI